MQDCGLLTPSVFMTRMITLDNVTATGEHHNEDTTMMRHELLGEKGILILHPDETLRAKDFSALAEVVDPYILQHGVLKGLMIDAPSFPGWDSFAALVSHLRFVRDLHQKIQRIAVVSDNKLLSVAPKIASQFVQAQLRTFDVAERAAALTWLETS
jgi:hypothetical protein